MSPPYAQSPVILSSLLEAIAGVTSHEEMTTEKQSPWRRTSCKGALCGTSKGLGGLEIPEGWRDCGWFCEMLLLASVSLLLLCWEIRERVSIKPAGISLGQRSFSTSWPHIARYCDGLGTEFGEGDATKQK